MSYIKKIPWIDPNGKYHYMPVDDYHISITCKDAVLFVNAPESDYYHASSLHLKRFGNDYMPHHESDPAFITYNPGMIHYHFFNGGISCRIEDLPCDDETKCILILKYEYHGKFGGMINYK